MAKKPNPVPAALMQQRRVQAAQAFRNRPQAGVQGAPQNRAERRAAARNAGRETATAMVNGKAVRSQQAGQPSTAREALAQAPAELVRDFRETAASVRSGLAGTPLFPWHQMPLSLPVFIVFAVLMVSWWNLVGAHPAWLQTYQEHFSSVTAVVTGGFFLSLIGVSARTYIPALLALLAAFGSAVFGDKLSLFGPGIVLAGVLGLSWVVGPIPGLGGKLFHRKKRAA